MKVTSLFLLMLGILQDRKDLEPSQVHISEEQWYILLIY